MSPRIAVIGSTNVDLFAQVRHHPRPGETVLGDGGQRAPGGKGANQALAARLRGAEVTFAGAVGTDSDAEVALERLRDAGVELSQLAVSPEAPTGLAIITVSEDGENTIVVVSGANATIMPGDAQEAVQGLAAEDIVLLQGELPRRTTEAAIRAAHAAGNRVVLNLAPWGEIDHDVLRLVDPLVVNEGEAAAVARALGLGESEDPATLAEGLVASGIRSVVITLGPQGSVVGDGAGVRTQPAPTVSAVDTTGAGDAFTGGLTARLAAGDDLDAATAQANRVGAFAAQRRGAQPSYPTVSDTLP